MFEESSFAKSSLSLLQVMLDNSGGILIAIGIAGMIAVGSNALSSIFGGGFSQQDQGTQFQMGQYVFMFILIAGLVLVIYSQIALQSARAKARERGRGSQ
jgi:uncharacterized membrane protein